MTATTASPRGLTRVVLSANVAVVFLFFYAPIALLTVFSFSNDRNPSRWGGFTLDWYREFGESQSLQDALRRSLWVALWSTIVSVILGTSSALALERFRFRGRRVFDALLYLPIIIPDVTMGIMMLIFFGDAIELVNDIFGTSYTKGIATITLAHIAFNISFVSVVVRARLAGMDQRMEEAARDLYASRTQAFRHVTLPQIMPGIAGGALLAVTISLDDVVVTQFSSGPGATTLPVFVFSLIRKGVTPLINATSVIMLTASVLLVLLSILTERLRANESTTTTTGGTP